MYHEFVERIIESVTRVTVLYHEVEPSSYRRDKFVYPDQSYGRLFFLQSSWCQRLNKFSITLKTYSALNFTSAIFKSKFILTSLGRLLT